MLKRIIALPFVMFVILIPHMVIYFKYLKYFILNGGEFIAYTCNNERKSINSIYQKVKGTEKLEYKLALSEQMNDRYKQFIETTDLEDEYDEYLDLFQEQ